MDLVPELSKTEEFARPRANVWHEGVPHSALLKIIKLRYQAGTKSKLETSNKQG